MTKKEILLRVIMDNDMNTSYESLIYLLDKLIYTKVLKCPAEIFVIGIIDTIGRYKSKGKSFDFTLEDLKVLLPELLSETNGIEVTYTDHEWDELEIIPHERWKPTLNTKKGYMSEFFEL